MSDRYEEDFTGLEAFVSECNMHFIDLKKTYKDTRLYVENNIKFTFLDPSLSPLYECLSQKKASKKYYNIYLSIKLCTHKNKKNIEKKIDDLSYFRYTRKDTIEDVLNYIYDYCNDDEISDFLDENGDIDIQLDESMWSLKFDFGMFLDVIQKFYLIYHITYYMTKNVSKLSDNFKEDFYLRFMHCKETFCLFFPYLDMTNERDIFDMLYIHFFRFYNDHIEKIRDYISICVGFQEQIILDIIDVYLIRETAMRKRYLIEDQVMETFKNVYKIQELIEDYSIDTDEWNEFKEYHQRYMEVVPFSKDTIMKMLFESYFYDYEY